MSLTVERADSGVPGCMVNKGSLPLSFSNRGDRRGAGLAGLGLDTSRDLRGDLRARSDGEPASEVVALKDRCTPRGGVSAPPAGSRWLTGLSGNATVAARASCSAGDKSAGASLARLAGTGDTDRTETVTLAGV